MLTDRGLVSDLASPELSSSTGAVCVFLGFENLIMVEQVLAINIQRDDNYYKINDTKTIFGCQNFLPTAPRHRQSTHKRLNKIKPQT